MFSEDVLENWCVESLWRFCQEHDLCDDITLDDLFATLELAPKPPVCWLALYRTDLHHSPSAIEGPYWCEEDVVADTKIYASENAHVERTNALPNDTMCEFIDDLVESARHAAQRKNVSTGGLGNGDTNAADKIVSN